MQDDAQPRPLGVVGPAPVPHAPQVEERGAGRHLDGGRWAWSGPGRSSTQRWLPATIRVAPLASVKSSQRPHHVDDQFLMRSGHGIDGVVGMQRLGHLARADGDGRRGAQLVITQHPVEHAQHDGVRGHDVEGAGLGEQRVDPPGLAALEVVAPRRRGLEDLLEVAPRRSTCSVVMASGMVA